jgi:hypothetical protein
VQHGVNFMLRKSREIAGVTTDFHFDTGQFTSIFSESSPYN